MSTPEELEELLIEVLRSPVHFRGARSARWRAHGELREVVPYSAMRLNDDLLRRIREAVSQ